MPAVVGNDQHRAFSGYTIDAIHLNPEILVVDFLGDGVADLEGFIVVAPGIIAKTANGLPDPVDLFIQFSRHQMALQER